MEFGIGADISETLQKTRVDPRVSRVDPRVSHWTLQKTRLHPGVGEYLDYETARAPKVPVQKLPGFTRPRFDPKRTELQPQRKVGTNVAVAATRPKIHMLFDEVSAFGLAHWASIAPLVFEWATALQPEQQFLQSGHGTAATSNLLLAWRTRLGLFFAGMAGAWLVSLGHIN